MVRATLLKVQTNWVHTGTLQPRLVVVMAPAIFTGGRAHDGPDLTKYSADAAGDIGHDSSRGNRDKPSHQGIFDQILSPPIAPDPHQRNQTSSTDHLHFLLED
jgi:hypothetical protein